MYNDIFTDILDRSCQISSTVEVSPAQVKRPTKLKQIFTNQEDWAKEEAESVTGIFIDLNETSFGFNNISFGGFDWNFNITGVTNIHKMN